MVAPSATHTEQMYKLVSNRPPTARTGSRGVSRAWIGDLRPCNLRYQIKSVDRLSPLVPPDPHTIGGF